MLKHCKGNVSNGNDNDDDNSSEKFLLLYS